MTAKQTPKWAARKGSSQLGRLRRRKAMERGEFVPYFQPLIEIRTGTLAGYEVLARWSHPEAGLLLPETFIDQAEVEGWIGDLTQSLMQRSFQCARNFGEGTTLALNVSPTQLQDLTLPEQIESAARLWHFEPNRLTVEITEKAFLLNHDRALLIARELKQIGCKLSLDDFGTGQSSFRTLQSLPIDEIKVDCSLIDSMKEHRESRKIVAAVIGLGQNLGIITVAQGVKTQEQADILLMLGCDLGQGYFYGEPAPVDLLQSEARQTRARKPLLPRIANPSLEHGLEGTFAETIAHLRAIFDGAPIGLAFLDCNLRYRNLNQRFADFNDALVEAHLGKPIAGLHPGDPSQVAEHLSRALNGEATHNVPLCCTHPVRCTKQTLLLSYQPVLDEANEVVGILIAALDPTQGEQDKRPLCEGQITAAM